MEKALDENYGTANVEDQKWLQELRDILNQYNVSCDRFVLFIPL